MREKENVGSVQPPEGLVLQREIALEAKFGPILLLAAAILLGGLALRLILGVAGVMPAINLDRFFKDQGRRLILIGQLIIVIAMIVLVAELVLLPIKKLVFKRMTGLKANVEFKISFVSVSVPFYFTKSAYLRSRLSATLILAGVLLAVILAAVFPAMALTVVCAFLPDPLFLCAYYVWIFYLLCNADDYYLAHVARRCPDDAVFYDMGRSLFVFLPYSGQTCEGTNPDFH